MNVAFIPVRGGSKSIPLKNIREMAGKPLVYWAAKAASECRDIDTVYLATDSQEIAAIVRSFKMDKVRVIGRSADNASDFASTESAMMEFAEEHEFDNFVLIQATSPLLTAQDLAGGFSEFYKRDTDSVLSVVRQKRFQWKVDAEGFASPVNYDVFNRPRRQEFDGFLVENGAFYITSRRLFMKSRNRVSGNIRVYEMHESAYFEVDEQNDWLIIEEQLKNRIKKIDFDALDIKMFLTDCDGCLTDGGMYYSEEGDELKKFNTLDGMGFRLLKGKGILTGIITGEKRMLNRRRSEKLELDIFEEGICDKLELVKQLCRKHNITLQNVAYIGDDINDIDLIKAVGFGCSVCNGIEDVKRAARYVTHKKGGYGAVREVADIVISHMNEKAIK
ncbi:MAG TPA: acylneuraminate cytidylyltransferase [Lachnospiraceae bacterium]|nr:acylneuraminate cytidylyltransferase [Lachnospiraceae bacterium]HBI61543.1 acylneuraminate cytidylyltransferase [Lachnospiraceae bacterium]